MKNKVTTCGYFTKRLRDNGFIVIRGFSDYAHSDPRKWSIIVDPAGASLFITCYQNKEDKDDVVFDFNDGGAYFRKNFLLKTTSMEIVITNLIEQNIPQAQTDSKYIKESSDIVDIVNEA